MADEQPSLWEWGKSKLRSRGTDETRKGSLDLSELPEALRECRESAVQLHRSLEDRLGVVDLIVTDNRRRMLSSRRHKHRQEIRVHHMFVECDDATVDAIADLATGKSGAREHLQTYVAENRDEIRMRPRDSELRTTGEFFELLHVLKTARDLLDSYDLDDIKITWGRRSRGRKSIRLGSFDFERRLVRVHPALDRDWVPRFFVEYIVYHELVHAVCPPKMGETRRNIHTQEFRALEQRFPRYEEAVEWESANLGRILDRE
jgi:hypothetical protein